MKADGDRSRPTRFFRVSSDIVAITIAIDSIARLLMNCHPERQRGGWRGGRQAKWAGCIAPSTPPGPSLPLGVTGWLLRVLVDDLLDRLPADAAEAGLVAREHNAIDLGAIQAVRFVLRPFERADFAGVL